MFGWLRPHLLLGRGSGLLAGSAQNWSTGRHCDPSFKGVCVCVLTDFLSVGAADEMHDGSESEDGDAFNSVQEFVDVSGEIGEQADLQSQKSATKQTQHRC